MKPAVIYEDETLLVLNKPAGMPAQPDPTEDQSLLDWANELTGKTMHLAHRIDRPVSGVVLLAKTAEAMTAVTGQFKDKNIDKTYLALVQAAPPMEEGTLTHYISKSRKQHKSLAFHTPQKDAEQVMLHYKILKALERYWLLEIRPAGGRFHQIRAQLAAIGCPIRGDVKYGAKRGNPDRSIQLHAWKIAFEHPDTGEQLTLTAPLPELPIWSAVEL